MSGIENFAAMIRAHSAGPEGDLHRFARVCYKWTDCGAWISFRLADGRRVGCSSGPEMPARLDGPERVVEIVVGSIVEGSDAEIGPYRLPVDDAFESRLFWDLLCRVDREAGEAWDEAHEFEEDEA